MSERTSGRRNKLLVRTGIIAVLVILVVIGIRSATHTDIEVRVATVGYGDLLSSLSTNGKVEPMDNFSAHAEAPGTVQAVYVHDGEHVAAGTLLLKMDAAAAGARVETGPFSRRTGPGRSVRSAQRWIDRRTHWHHR